MYFLYLLENIQRDISHKFLKIFPRNFIRIYGCVSPNFFKFLKTGLNIFQNFPENEMGYMKIFPDILYFTFRELPVDV